MNVTRPTVFRRNEGFASRSVRALMLIGCLVWAALSGTAFAITNVTVVNVTSASFSVVWRATDVSPSMAVFADAGGLTNLAGQVGIEPFPLHTGNPSLSPGYDRRLGRSELQQKTHASGLVQMRVVGCRPNTTYYFRISSTPATGNPEIFPAAGPLPAVTTAPENSFVANYQQLIIDIPGLDMEGRVVLLTHTNALHPLAAVIGDGAGTNQVFFDVNNLRDLTQGGNFTPVGAQDFAVNVLGPEQSDLTAHFTLNFNSNFSVAQGTVGSVGNEFLAVTVGSAMVLAGQTNAITLSGNSSVGLSNIDLTLDLPPGHLTNFALAALASELNPAASAITPLGGASWRLHFAAQAGQTFSGAKPIGQLTFLALSNQASAFVPLQVTGLAATKPDAVPVSQLVAQSGRVVVVGTQPLLEALRAPDGARTLKLYARPNATYAIEYAAAVAGSNAWTFWLHVPMTNLSMSFQPSHPSNPAVFYRAYEFTTDPPVLESQVAGDGTRQLLLYGKPGASYAVEYEASLSDPGGWQLWVRVPLTNSFTTLLPGKSIQPTAFYRAREFTADPPLLVPLLQTNHTGTVLLYGVPGRNYRLEMATGLGPTPNWIPGPQLNLTNSFQFFNGLNLSSNIFVRAHQQ